VSAESTVEEWFAHTKPPAEAAMRRVREVILAADPRVIEYVKYGSPTFAYEGDIRAFVQHRKESPVSLMFNRGARIPGDFPHLEGTGPSGRFMRFADLAEVEARAEELASVIRAWCELVATHRR
jgi:hypothetical protein